MTETLSVPLTVVGAGPAGIMAAAAAAAAGVEVLLIDDNPRPGGQYFQQSPAGFQFANPVDGLSGRADAATTLGKLHHPKIKLLNGTSAWGVFGQHDLAVADDKQSSFISTNRVILATGAYDRPFAFPGWTLPGILGAGAVLRLLKAQWVLPGRRILLAGLGPLQLALAAALIKAGAEVVCVAEAAPNPMAGWQQLPKLWGHWDRLQEAIRYFSTLTAHRTPLLYNHAIVGASGNGHVEKAQIARLDASGAPIPGTEKQFAVDAVCLGYGLLPSFQLAAAFGCKLRFDPDLAWWAPEHNETMETSQPGIFVAGDVTDIGGAKVALVEGQIAGLQAARQLGAIDANRLSERLGPLQAKLRHLNRAAEALQKLYPYRPGLARAARDDTLLCRCEEITFGQAKKALAHGAVDLHQLKLATRTGMGYCQGRFCSILAAPLVAEATGRPLSSLSPFTVRPPIQPIALSLLGSGAPDYRPAQGRQYEN
jgi:D-hydroxyproline dehydrogenase subunit alpha